MFAKTIVVLLGAVCFAAAEFSVEKELGYFAKCKGKDVHYPPDMIATGALHLSACTNEEFLAGQTNIIKACLGMCVSEKFGYIKADRTYDWDAAVKPLQTSSIDKEVVAIQSAALKKCGVQGQLFTKANDCGEAKKFEDCIRKAQETDCA